MKIDFDYIQNHYWEPHSWPRWLRRLFVATFPISIPLWFLGFCAFLCGIIVLLPLLLAVWGAYALTCIWNGEKQS